MISFSKSRVFRKILTVDNLQDVEIGGINVQDYPDFADAYISYAALKVGPFLLQLSDEDLSYLTENNSSYVNELAYEQCVEY